MFGLVGKSLPHTLSPEIHAILGDDHYGIFELESEEELRAFIRDGGADGFNVTIPYKQAVMPMLDQLDDEARAIGAVNTVVRRGEKLYGYNTDIRGMQYALEKVGIMPNGRHVLVLGSGGTSHTAQYLCKKLGAASIDVVSRTGKINYENCYELRDTQIIINTTPVGMYPNAFARPVELTRFERLEGVFDAVYNPLRTLLIQDALKFGIRANGGLDMLVEQARAARKLFGGEEKIGAEEACRRLERKLDNIVLIGMAGSGKTSIGRELALLTGREFVDTDEIVEKDVGKSIPQIFAEGGNFREYESRVVKDVCSGFGRVIAVGGGAVLREINRFYIKSNAKVVLIRRNEDELALEGRPLSADRDTAKKLSKERAPIYEGLADIRIDNDSDIHTAAKKIAEALL